MEEENSILSNDYRSIYLDPYSMNSNLANLSTKDTFNQDENTDIIPTRIKIIYSIPSFGKMSCLVLLK
jgi:hypothetical protein